MNLIIIYITFCLLSLISIIVLLLNAPIGWEDMEGFHKAENNIW